MKFRVSQDLYEQLQWAVAIRPDLSISDVCRMANDYRDFYWHEWKLTDPLTQSGDVVLTVDFRDRPPLGATQDLRIRIASYLRDQRAKIEARQVKPLEFVPCTNYIVEVTQ